RARPARLVGESLTGGQVGGHIAEHRFQLDRRCQHHGPTLPNRIRDRHTPASASIQPRAKYSRKPAATTHSSGLTSRALPTALRITTQEMNPIPMPLAIE